MGDSDDEGLDFSNALLETVDDIENSFSFNDAPVIKRRRAVISKNGSVEDLDLFSNESPVKSKFSGSSFKNMGNLT